MVYLAPRQKGVWKVKEYRLYPLKDQDRLPQICALFAKGLADTVPDYWKWKHYTENGHPEGMILVAEAEDGVFAGMFALQPVRYVCGDRELVMVQTQDLVIDPDHRGTGLMKKLYRFAADHYAKEGAAGFMAFCNAASYPVFVKYGSRDMGDIYCRNTPKSLLPIYAKKTRWAKDGWLLELTDAMPSDLFYSVSSERFRMKKCDTFMKWKFADNPEDTFRWLTIRKDGQLRGYLVVHITQGRLRRAVNIYDWELDAAVSGTVLRQAVKLLLTHGNWVSLWGLYSDAALGLWAEAGITDRDEKGSHFLLYDFGRETLPDNWQLTRADLDY